MWIHQYTQTRVLFHVYLSKINISCMWMSTVNIVILIFVVSPDDPAINKHCVGYMLVYWSGQALAWRNIIGGISFMHLGLLVEFKQLHVTYIWLIKLKNLGLIQPNFGCLSCSLVASHGLANYMIHLLTCHSLIYPISLVWMPAHLSHS